MAPEYHLSPPGVTLYVFFKIFFQQLGLTMNRQNFIIQGQSCNTGFWLKKKKKLFLCYSKQSQGRKQILNSKSAHKPRQGIVIYIEQNADVSLIMPISHSDVFF